MSTHQQSQQSKRHVRISPLLLGKIGDVAAGGSHGASIVQFAGQCVSFNDGQEWHVTHAVISNSLEVLEPAARAAHNRSVEELIRSENLTHIGWLRQASAACPLSSLDMDTQRVYQAHVADAFAAMLDVSAESSKGPCLYFYCLQGSHANLGHTFTPAHHMILDSTIPFTLIPCPSAASECDAALTPGNPYKCGGIGQQSRAGQDTYDGADTSNNSTSSARSAASMDLPRTNSGRVIEY